MLIQICIVSDLKLKIHPTNYNIFLFKDFKNIFIVTENILKKNQI